MDTPLTEILYHHQSTGMVSSPEQDCSFTAFPRVGFSKAVTIGISAGAVGVLS